jgi:hypothetical protein
MVIVWCGIIVVYHTRSLFVLVELPLHQALWTMPRYLPILLQLLRLPLILQVHYTNNTGAGTVHGLYCTLLLLQVQVLPVPPLLYYFYYYYYNTNHKILYIFYNIKINRRANGHS